MRFSANTGFLFKDLPFLHRIGAAKAAGFDAVEFHDEAQGVDRDQLAEALSETGLSVCGLNIRMGDTAGCAAIPGSEAQARADIDAAVIVANAIDVGAIHVLSGRTDAEPDAARRSLIANLRYALDRSDRTILIEPICRAAMPNYFLYDLDQAVSIIDEIDDPRLKILFDCYHVETQHGACLDRFKAVRDHVGHVQIASIPGRNEPTTGELDYRALLPQLVRAGYTGAFGCEYRPLVLIDPVLAELRGYAR